MEFFHNWFLSGIPITILAVSRLFSYFRIKGVDQMLKGVISNTHDLEIVKNAICICAACSLLSVALGAILILFSLLLLWRKATSFGVILMHFLLFLLVSMLGYSLTVPYEDLVLNMRIKSSNPIVETRYTSFVEQYRDGIFIIKEPDQF